MKNLAKVLGGLFAKDEPQVLTAKEAGPEIDAALEIPPASNVIAHTDRLKRTPHAAPIQPPTTPETAAIATAQLLDAIKSWILTYVVISEEQATILAVWVLHTYVLNASDITPYIHITAPEKESGKSLLMDVLAAVACNPIRSGGMTAAALVRIVDRHHPTLFLDEMDAAMGGDKEFAEAQRGILNEGFHRGGRFFK